MYDPTCNYTVWTTAGDAASKQTAVLTRVDAHRRRGGPYAAAAALVRELVPVALDRWPELVRTHEIEILCVAPDLATCVPATRQTLAALAIPDEHTRFYSPMRIVRIGHGLVDLVNEHLGRLGDGPLTLIVDNAEHGDPTDLEFLAALCRRVDPELLTVELWASAPELPPLLSDLVPGALRRRGSQLGQRHPDTLTLAERAERYVGHDCVGSDADASAYDALDVATRAELHDSRARHLEKRGDPADRLGALAFHREHGSEASSAGVELLLEGQRFCLDRGFYDAAIDFGYRVRALTSWDSHPQANQRVMAQTGMALMVMGRLDEARALMASGRANSTDPTLHLQCCYGYAMLLTRFEPDASRDHGTARQWVNTAIAMSTCWPDEEQRTFLTVFHQNALALVEVHLGNLNAALSLVTEGLRRLDTELPPDTHRLHRSVLLYNRAQVHAALGDHAAAVSDYSAVIEQDPHHPEYYFDRGNLYRRLGRLQEALADYESAIRCSPPFAEAYYNRADALAELGELDRAIADFGYVIDIDPDNLAAYVNRAGLLIQIGALDKARSVVAAGLTRDQRDPSLHCLRGSIAWTEGNLSLALTSYDRALALAPELTEAWSGRANAWFDLGRVDRAVADLTRALSLSPSADAYYNRAVAHHFAGEDVAARADLIAALQHGLDLADVKDLLDEVDRVLAGEGDTAPV